MTERNAVRSSTPGDLLEKAPGIFYTDCSFVNFDSSLVSFLKDRARVNVKRRARLCAHPSPDADQHDMLIVSHRDTYVAPHRHLTKSESFLVVEGAATALLFSEDGRNVERLRMGSAGSGLPFFYRMPARQFHSLSIESEFLVFVEGTKGPFRPDDMENAPWAPGPEEFAAGRAFIESLGSKR
jgi:cupin fold WbuC family metalloprotein